MFLVAFKNDNSLFRAVKLTFNDDLDKLKRLMLSDVNEDLTFLEMTDDEFESYLESLPKPEQPPSDKERIEQLEQVINMILMGGI